MRYTVTRLHYTNITGYSSMQSRAVCYKAFGSAYSTSLLSSLLPFGHQFIFSHYASFFWSFYPYFPRLFFFVPPPITLTGALVEPMLVVRLRELSVFVQHRTVRWLLNNGLKTAWKDVSRTNSRYCTIPRHDLKD